MGVERIPFSGRLGYNTESSQLLCFQAKEEMDMMTLATTIMTMLNFKIHDAWSDGGSTGPMGETQGVEALKMLQYRGWQDWFAGRWARSEALATGSSSK